MTLVFFLAAAAIHISSLLLGYLPFRRQFGMGRNQVVLFSLCITVLHLGHAVCDMLLFQQIGIRVLLSFLTELTVAAICWLFARKSFYFHLFLAFMVKSYTDSLALAATTILTHLSRPRELDWILFLLFDCLLFVMTIPLLYFPLRRYVGAMLGMEPDRALWRYLCIIPMGAFFLYRVAISPHYLGLTWRHWPLLTSVLWPYVCFLAYFTVLKMICTGMEAGQLAQQIRIANLTADVKAKQNQRLQALGAQAKQEQVQLLDRLQILQGRLDGGDSAGAEVLLSEWLGQFDQAPSGRVCENAAVDGFVQQYLQWAVQAGIRAEICLSLPDKLPIPELDFFVVLGNLLENAMEACVRQTEGERFFKLRCRIAGGSLVLSVTNSYSGSIVTRGDLFYSSKQEGRIGLGVASVRAVAARYDGTARFTGENGQFEASVLLPLPPDPGTNSDPGLPSGQGG